jgi:DNA-binding transcriptional MerR regulator
VRIGEVARKSGVTIDTLRFYERQKLLPPAARGASNYREFPPVTIERLKFIRGARELGFTLAEVRDLLQVRTQPATGCEALRQRAQTKVVELEEQIRRLRRVKSALIKLLKDCEARAPAVPCEITQSVASLWRGKESVRA